MIKLFQLISMAALIATIIPAVLFMSDTISLDMMKTNMMVATFAWFIVTPFWMGRKVDA